MISVKIAMCSCSTWRERQQRTLRRKNDQECSVKGNICSHETIFSYRLDKRPICYFSPFLVLRFVSVQKRKMGQGQSASAAHDFWSHFSQYSSDCQAQPRLSVISHNSSNGFYFNFICRSDINISVHIKLRDLHHYGTHIWMDGHTND